MVPSQKSVRTPPQIIERYLNLTEDETLRPPVDKTHTERIVKIPVQKNRKTALKIQTQMSANTF